MGPEQLFQRLSLAESLFTPREAIKRRDQLAGRNPQIVRVLKAITSAGAHCIIFGERGVGKTSVANCVIDIVEDQQSNIHVFPLVSCDTSDSFDSVWRKAFARVEASKHVDDFGFSPGSSEQTWSLDEVLPESVTPFVVQQSLRRLTFDGEILVAFDEFDRLMKHDPEASALMADTMKAISDQGILATIVIIGVSDSVTDLIQGHESIARHLVEVPMPRMSPEEQEKIVQDRLPLLGLEIDKPALVLMVSIARGLPYYMHLIGRAASSRAIRDDLDAINRNCVMDAMQEAIDESEESLRSSYYTATSNPHPNNQLPATLAACAMAKTDAFGYFYPKSVAEPLSRITGKKQTTPMYNNRLKKLASPERGAILSSTGERYNARFRFTDPMMQPFVVIKTLADHVATLDQLLGRRSS